MKAKDKTLDIFLQAYLTAIVRTLGLYLDSGLSFRWRTASLIVSKSQGHGVYCACKICHWIYRFLTTGALPLHCYHGTCFLILGDEDIASQIQLHLSERAQKGFIKAQDVVDIVASPEIQEQLQNAGTQQHTISEYTGWDWLKQFGWWYGKKKNGMYIDGHKTKPSCDGFMGNLNGCPFRLILMTHDKSTFYANDEQKT